MIPYVIRLTAGVLLFIATTPGVVGEIVLCLGADGHLQVAVMADHNTDTDHPEDASVCHDADLDSSHGPCSDLVICSSGDLSLARSPLPHAKVRSVALPLPLSTLPEIALPRAAERVHALAPRGPPRPPAHLAVQRTVLLLI